MKFPALINFEQALAELANFDCIIDVRSPGEFAEDHIPGAINCPVLSDVERIRVGTCYKQVGAFEAKKIGAALVAKNIAQQLELHFLEKPKTWRPLIYCWRGGNRSGSMAHIFAKIGWPVYQLEGGYKGFRHFINQDLPRLAANFQWQVICGPTGSCKSRLLEALHRTGSQVLNLEQLAQHRGSVLGDLPLSEQPSQKHFETQVWNQLRSFDSRRPVYVEAESKKVGNLRIPDALMEHMRQGDCLEVELDLEHRIDFLCEDYQHFVNDHKALKTQLGFLTQLHGKATIQSWIDLIEQGNLKELVRLLLQRHYDPAYQKGSIKNFVKFGQRCGYPLANHQTSNLLELAHKISLHEGIKK